MKKLAIIGASYLQNPLILKAKEMGLETHVFAWGVGDVGEATADFFYPISIVEKEAICEKCKEIGIDAHRRQQARLPGRVAQDDHHRRTPLDLRGELSWSERTPH